MIFSSLFGLNSTVPETKPETSTEITTESTAEETTENSGTDETTTEENTEKQVCEFTYLEYPAEAVKTIAANNTSVDTLLERAKENNDDVYEACQGYEDVNGLIISPYYTATVEGTSVPVYAATTYIGTGKGALHSFSEIYIEEGAYDTFELKLTGDSSYLTIKDAVYMTTDEKVNATVENGTVKVQLTGYGIYTFLVNSESLEYAYTLFVREQIDDDAEIKALEDDGYTVLAYEGYIDFYDTFKVYYSDITGASKLAVYLKQGAYVVASNKQDISSASDLYTEADSCAGIGGLTRHPLVGGSGVNNIKIMGHGVFDFTELDRAERKGFVFSWGSNIEFSGIKIVNAPEWAIQTYRIDGLTIKDVDIFGYRLNADAFDICNTQNATITNCFARSGDDLFAVKTLGGEDAEACYSTNITVSDCVAWASKARAFGILGEANLNISDITFKDCAVICHDATWADYEIAAIGIMVTECTQKTTPISDVTFENINIYRNDAADFSCYVTENAGKGATMSNITFKNISYPSNTVTSKVYSTNSGTTFNTFIFENVYCGNVELPGTDYANYIETTSNVSGFDFR